MVMLKGKLSELFCCCGTKSEHCLIVELRGKPSCCFSVVEHLEDYKINELFVLFRQV